jgi:mannitol-1-phosphate/altronate dehydrogenase
VHFGAGNIFRAFPAALQMLSFTFHRELEPILSNPLIFGLNLYEAGLGNRVEACFEELIAGPGAVRETLRRYTGD